LVHQIETGLHKRSGKAVTNFDKTLPPPQSDLAQQITKDPWYGPIVMNTQEQSRQAMGDLQKGTFIKQR